PLWRLSPVLLRCGFHYPQDARKPHFAQPFAVRTSARTPKPRRSKEMSPLKRSNNIAARMGRWSASHWKTAVSGWLAFAFAAFYIGNVVGTKNIKSEDTGTGQSHRADQ